VLFEEAGFLQLLSSETYAMLRSFFFAIGMFVALVGGSLLQVERIVLTSHGDLVGRDLFGLLRINGFNERIVDPPDWAPFSLMAIGAVTLLYSCALPARRQSRG